MKTYLAFGAIVLGALLQTTTVHAQYRSFITDDSRWYWRLDAGASIAEDGKITDFGGVNLGQKVSYDVGFAGDAGFGYFFNKYVGTELELGFVGSYLNSVEGASIHDTSFATIPILANIILQYEIPRTIIVPYIGGGVGGAATYFDAHEYHQPVPGGTVNVHGSESDFVFAWQAQAGVRFNVNSYTSVGLAYRYLYLDGSKFSYEADNHNGPDLNIGFSAFKSHLVTLSVLVKF